MTLREENQKNWYIMLSYQKPQKKKKKGFWERDTCLWQTFERKHSAQVVKHHRSIVFGDSIHLFPLAKQCYLIRKDWLFFNWYLKFFKEYVQVYFKEHVQVFFQGVHQGHISSPCLFNLYAEYIMWNGQARWSTSCNQDFWKKYQ